MEYRDIGMRIRDRRRELDMSAADLAARLSLSKATIHRYENGDIRNIKLPVVEAMARELGVNALWLIGKAEAKEADPCDENDLLSLIDRLVECVRETAYMTANGIRISEEDRRIVLTGLGFTRDYVSRIK